MAVIGIVGTRRRDSRQDFLQCEKSFLEIYKDGDEIVSGGCPKGADAFAERLADKYSIEIVLFLAEWSKYGRAAGFIRNGDIASLADYLIACVADDRTGGTEDTIKKFLKKLQISEGAAIERGLLILI